MPVSQTVRMRVEGKTGGHLWAERFDRDLTDIFALQDGVTGEIVPALSPKPPAGAHRRHRRPRRKPRRAHDC